ncbi:MAG TPA: alpha/beta fold hydrolase [Chryseolinea sp.]|nr:alpha/beta fold hydrolase [Chryseolinea sp.]
MRRFILSLTFTLFASLAFSQMEDFAGRRKINGTNLYFSVKGKGDYLLVIHGGPGLNHSYFKPYLKPLENTFKVVYFDQRACGKSSIPASDSISLKFLVDDIEEIRKVLKTEKINILAHSWGVVLAIQYGLQYPGRISKLILSDPVMLSREYDQEAAALVQKKSTKEDSVVRAKIVSDGNLDTKDYEELFRLSFNPSAYNRDNVAKINLNLPDNFGVANNALFTGLMKDPSMNANLYDSLRSLKFSVLVIHGQADVVPLSSVKRLNENLPKAQLEVFQRSGHFPFVEESVLYNEKVNAFFKADH